VPAIVRNVAQQTTPRRCERRGAAANATVAHALMVVAHADDEAIFDDLV